MPSKQSIRVQLPADALFTENIHFCSFSFRLVIYSSIYHDPIDEKRCHSHFHDNVKLLLNGILTYYWNQSLYLRNRNLQLQKVFNSVGGVTVSMVAFQAVDPGSTPGRRTFCRNILRFTYLYFHFNVYATRCKAHLNVLPF